MLGKVPRWRHGEAVQRSPQRLLSHLSHTRCEVAEMTSSVFTPCQKPRRELSTHVRAAAPPPPPPPPPSALGVQASCLCLPPISPAPSSSLLPASRWWLTTDCRSRVPLGDEWQHPVVQSPPRGGSRCHLLGSDAGKHGQNHLPRDRDTQDAQCIQCDVR